MAQPTTGIHHITAIASDPRKNLAFYTQMLDLRLVKKTVNFDDPSTYHFYFGDHAATVGAIWTFFPFAGARHGRHGIGEVETVSFLVPRDSIRYWYDRLKKAGQIVGKPEERFNEEFLTLIDPDGISLELVDDRSTDTPKKADESLPDPGHAIRGFQSATFFVRKYASRQTTLEDILGYKQVGEEKGRIRFMAQSGEIARYIDVVERPDLDPAFSGAGSVHHIAFRARDDEHQRELRELVSEKGMGVTEVRERHYFRSIYYREPSGILFEIATDNPGFAIDEEIDSLGTSLKLPPWLEKHRRSIEDSLQPLDQE